MSGRRPPAWARRLLELALPTDGGSEMVGDLEEEYVRRLEDGAGGGAARWYVREAVRLALAFSWERVRERSGRRPKGVGPKRREAGMMEGLGKDVRFAVRTLSRAPGFAAVVLLTLALGIGATVAIFSVVDGILLRPLPYPDPDELVVVWADHTQRRGPEREWLSPRDWEDLRVSDAYEEIAVYTDFFQTLTGQGEPVELAAAPIGGHMFRDVLKVSPALGRTFGGDEFDPGAPRVAILSHGLWRSRFGGDGGILGRDIMLNGEPVTVIGVMPAGFRPPFAPNAQLWMNWRMDVASSSYGSIFIRTIGRLAEGVTLAQADARAGELSVRNAETFPEANRGKTLKVYPLHGELVATASTSLWILLGAVVLMLLIVCVNVANLLLARAAGRQGEFAVRAALGAGRGRVGRLLLVESLALAVVGGVAGIALAFLGVEFLTTLAPEGTPRIAEVAVDGRILAFAVGTSLLVGLLFGAVPALRAGRTDLRSTLVEGGRAGGGRRAQRARSLLVVAQVALALVLLVGAGLLIRSFRELTRVDLGFEPESRLVVGVRLPVSRYEEPAQRIQFFERLEERLSSLPGVRRAGAVSNLPMMGFDSDVSFDIEGRPPPEPGSPQATWWRRVTPGYLETMGVEIIRGRGITAADDAEATPVVVINETFAARYFTDRDAVGQRINVNNPSEPVWREVVGVAEDTKHFGVRREAEEATYVPYPQSPGPAMNFVAETSVEPASVAPAVRRTLHELDPLLAASQLEPLTDVVAASLAQDRFVMALLMAFAALALLLAMIGLYGVMSYQVASRNREIGVRLAVGAGTRHIVRLVVSQGLLVAGIGVAAGLAGALAATTLMESLLFGVSSRDPATFAFIPVLLLAVAGVAAWLPARRAGRVDPVSALNPE